MLERLLATPVSKVSALLLAVVLIAAVGAPWLSPYDATDLAAFDIADANLPPAWFPDGSGAHLLGTDNQGRDLFSAILSGTRLSLAIGVTAALLSLVLGVSAGLVAGYAGGVVDAVLMRLCDVMLAFPTLLAALLVDGVLRTVLGESAGEGTLYAVLLIAMTVTGWVPYARTVRGLARTKRSADFVSAAKLSGVSETTILLRHVLPNVMGPVFVLGTLNLSSAVMTEATLSFLGVGVPPTTPSLGTLIRIGNDFLFSGEWWIALFPSAVLAVTVFSVNFLGGSEGVNEMLEENTKKSPILEVEGLTVRRADGAALLEDVSVTVNAGEILGLVGESSAGKSMIGNAVAGLLPAGVTMTAGRIVLEGREIQNLSAQESRKIRGPKIGMVLQDPLGSLNPLLTVGEHFRETFAAHGIRLTDAERLERSTALLREAGLPEPEKRLGQYPHELSGGLRQRVVIALDPILLVADEPTTALDVSVQAQITALLRRLAKERGCAVLLITHDMGVIAETTDRTAVLYSGRVVEEGDTESLMKTPQHPYTKGLMGSIPDTESSSLWLEQIDGVMPDPAKRPSGCPFHPRCRAVQKRCETERPELADCGGSSAACWLAADNGRSVPDSVVRFHPPLKRSWKTLEAGRLEALGAAPEILRVEDVRKIFTLRRAGLIERLAGGRDDVTVAVDGVTLSVRRGETVALVGESGCGKSTFARIAAGLLAPDGGKVTVNGKDVKVLGAGHVNMIFQDPYASLNPRMSVAAIWEEPLKSLRPEMGAPERRAKLRELARLVGLPEEALEKYPHEFSGGQRQRISIARAVAAGPDLLICDEPTSALDVSVQAQVLNLLKTLQLERGLSMLFISHNLGVVRHIADTVGVMYRGQIVEWAPKEALFEDPLHPYTRMLLDSVPRIDGGKRCTAKHAATEGDVPDGCPFAPRCAEARLECRSGKVFLEVVTGAQGLRKVACRRTR